MDRKIGKFIWDTEREAANIVNHGIGFTVAARAFVDINRRIFTDSKHSDVEPRYFRIGMVDRRIVTVRFTYREGYIRIFGAGYWRKGKAYYEKT